LRVERIFRAKLYGLACLALAALVLAGCATSADEQAHERDADGLPIEHIPVRYATALADDPETLADSMDAVFAGEVIGVLEQRSVSAGEGDERPLPLSVFVIRVDASAGEPAVGSVVEFEQLGGVADTANGPVHVVLEGDELLAVGQSYVFVARQDGPATFSASAFARFPVEEGRLAAPKGWEETGAAQALAGLTVDEAIARLSR
jgi:hypothetical protein